MEWIIFVLMIPVLWFLQNFIHEGSHLLAGWIVEGRKPLKLIPWPHKFAYRFYFARYECGFATKDGPVLYRHAAPYIVGSTILTMFSCIAIWTNSLYVLAFGIFPFIDCIVWLYGYVFNRPGTDGFRFKTER
jgi:hypothetical protein